MEKFQKLMGTHWEVELESSLGLNVGFATTSVKVTIPPLLNVDVNVEVISGGANEVVCPKLLVVWMKTVLENVVLCSCQLNITMR